MKLVRPAGYKALSHRRFLDKCAPRKLNSTVYTLKPVQHKYEE